MLSFFSGTLTNIRTLVVGSGQKLTLSSNLKTATFSNNKYTLISEPGAYTFTQLTVKYNAETIFEETPHQISFYRIELNYGATLVGKNLNLAANFFDAHPGSTLNMTGMGFAAEEGPGKGRTVCLLNS